MEGKKPLRYRRCLLVGQSENALPPAQAYASSCCSSTATSIVVSLAAIGSPTARESPLPFVDFELPEAVSKLAELENALAVARTKYFCKMDNFIEQINNITATIIQLQS
ncbi:hypothetical protein M9H77_35902 [Catharanthus roseus]|uniref:Uncharacterized protein n=1 Tax=Catharanthus roseus TaxID=4058 RepID=A0ACB9ZQA7_CATRO|nr:hypothetical protein M9H77_35902 [Catharanthus roseus]